MNPIEIVQKIGDIVCEGCGPDSDCGVDPEECGRIDAALEYLGEYEPEEKHEDLDLQADHFLGIAIKEVAYQRKPKDHWSENGLHAWIRNSIIAYRKDREFKTVLRALELACSNRKG